MTTWRYVRISKCFTASTERFPPSESVFRLESMNYSKPPVAIDILALPSKDRLIMYCGEFDMRGALTIR